jgi:hypothetical protein
MRRYYPCSLTFVRRRCPCSSTSTDHRPRPLTADIERGKPSVITGHRPRSPDPCATRRQFCVEQACHRPSSPNPPSAAPLSPGRTLHHESPDPPSDSISTHETDIIHGRADVMGCAAPRAGSAPRSPPMRRTSLLRGPPSDPWEGHRCKMRSTLCSDGSPSPVVTTGHDVNPLLLPCPTMSVASSGDPSPTAPLPPIPRVVTGCLECCCGARVWLQD